MATHSVSIPVTVGLTDVNDAPIFSDGESATRSLPENSAANVNLGSFLHRHLTRTDTPSPTPCQAPTPPFFAINTLKPANSPRKAGIDL